MKLSVCMITYNHERYIRNAVDSVLMQQVDFDYELVIGEDCSTDATRQILLDYERKHPDKFRLLLREKNVGAQRNAFSALESCRGQYIALLEGDDYWTHPEKLKRQVAFLDAHPDYAICFHNVIGRFEGGGKPDFHYVRADQQETMTLQDLLEENVIPTCSSVFRGGRVTPFPAWIYDLKMGDYPLHILNAQHGKIAYMNETMAVYRIHGGGIWTGLDWITRQEANIALFEQLARNLEPKYRPAARLNLARKYWQLVGEYEFRGDIASARRHALLSLRTRVFTTTPRFQHKLKVLTRVCVPSAYDAAGRLYSTLTRPRGPAFPAVPAPQSPRVSVVIPAYNAQRYLTEAIESVLCQTFTDFECIVVDDGSTDRTARILVEMAERDGRVRTIRIPHGGIVEALNAGAREARGDLIARMDSDDICLPERLARQVRYMDQHPECLALGAAVMLVDPYGSTLWEIDIKTEHAQIEAELLKGNGWALFHPTALIRKGPMLEIGGYRPEYQWSEDIDLFLRLAEIGKLANLPDTLLHYRQHFASVNRNKVELQLRRNERLLAEAYRRRGRALPTGFRLEPPFQLPPREQIMAWGRRAIINGNLRVARRHALAAVRFSPLRKDTWHLMYHAVKG